MIIQMLRRGSNAAEHRYSWCELHSPTEAHWSTTKSAGMWKIGSSDFCASQVDKGINETDGMLCSHGVVEPLRKQDRFMAVRAVEKTHAGLQLHKSKKVSRCREHCYSLPKHCVCTQSGAAADRFQRPFLLPAAAELSRSAAEVRPMHVAPRRHRLQPPARRECGRGSGLFVRRRRACVNLAKRAGAPRCNERAPGRRSRRAGAGHAYRCRR